MSNGNTWGYLDDWFDDLESKIDPGLAGYDAPPEGWTYWNREGQGTGGYEDYLRELYDETTRSMDSPIPYDLFKKRFAGVFDTYDPTMEGLKEEAYTSKVAATEEEFAMLEEHKGEELALYEKYYGIDPDDDFESITELKERQTQENILLDKRSERQKVINAGVDYAVAREKILSDSIKTGLKQGNTETIVEDLTTEFWSKMKVVRNSYEKSRLKQIQAIDDLILQSSQKLEKKEFQARQTLEEAFITAEGNIKEGALSLLIDKRDLKDQFEEDTWETMGYLAGSDALTHDSDTSCINSGECADGQKCLTSGEKVGQCVDMYGSDDPNTGDGIASDSTPCTADQLFNDCVTRTKIVYGQSGWFSGYQTTEEEVEYCDCRPNEGYDSHCCEWVQDIGGAPIPGETYSGGHYEGSCCPEGDGEGELPWDTEPPEADTDEETDCVNGGGAYTFFDSPEGYGLGSGHWCCVGGSNADCGSDGRSISDDTECPQGYGTECEGSGVAGGRDCPPCAEVGSGDDAWTPDSICSCGNCGCSGYPNPFN